MGTHYNFDYCVALDVIYSVILIIIIFIKLLFSLNMLLLLKKILHIAHDVRYIFFIYENITYTFENIYKIRWPKLNNIFFQRMIKEVETYKFKLRIN